MKKYLLLLLLPGFCACHQAGDGTIKKQAADSLSKSMVNQLPGVYFGVVPCPDCPGIEYTLTLNPDSSFYLKSVHYGRPSNENTAVEAGDWSLVNAGEILLETPQMDYYMKINAKSLLMLDENGKEYTGTKANYQLSRMGKFDY